MRLFRNVTRCLLLLAPLAAQGALATKATEKAQEKGKDKQEVNLYTTRHYDGDIELTKSFEAATGIKVNMVQIKEASQLIARAIQEAKNPKADLLITADIGNLTKAAAGGVFGALDSKVIEQTVPAHLRDPSGKWTGLAMRARVIAYNPTKVTEDTIARIEDLANPRFKGKLLVRSSSHVYNQSLAATLLAASGPEGLRKWAQGVTANLARKPQGGDTDQIKALATGEGDVAIVNSYYAARLLASEDPKDKAIMDKVRLKFPNQNDRGTHLNISGGGIMLNAKNQNNARKFLEYLVSQDAQKIFALASKEYPVRTDVAAHPTLATFGTPKFDSDGLGKIGKNSPEALRILDEVGWR